MKELRGLCVSVCLQNIPFRFENCSFLSFQNTVDCIYPWTHHRLWKLSQMFPRRRCFEIRHLNIYWYRIFIYFSEEVLDAFVWFSLCQLRDFRKFGAYFWLTRVGNRAFTGRCNRRVLYVYQEETCPSVAVGGFCSKGWKKTWVIAVEFCFQILCK